MARGKQTVGRYVLRKRLGDGLNGVVYLADDPSLGRQVAVKILKSKSASARDLASFPSEARAVGRLRHPNVVSVHDAGHVNGRPYLVFEYVHGITLFDLLAKQGALALDRGAVLARQILDGVAHAHAHGVVHLDLGPRNIILDRQGVAKVMDFGLARLVDAPVGDETEDEVSGTLLYMSPEHLSRTDVGAHSDVYSIGLILHEVLTGRSAVRTGRITDVLRRVAAAKLELDALQSDAIDPAFVHFLLDALRADPDARYPDASAMRDALDDWQASRQARSEAAQSHVDHSTVAFLLRRMQRRKDFPALSRSLAEVNRLSAPDSNASADQLAAVILRDFALTNKLLKLANSAFYGAGRGTVSSVSAAITLLGFEQVRMAANSLSFVGHLQDGSDDPGLRDLLTASFMAGLVTRHLARRAGQHDPEGAFIAGLFQRLGKTLVRCHFREDDVDIAAAVDEHGLDEDTAARGVLGITYADLGVAVGGTWGFPDTLLHCIRGLAPDDYPEPADGNDVLRDQAVYANRLCTLAHRTPRNHATSALDELSCRFLASVPLDGAGALALLEQAQEKLLEFAPVLGLDVTSSELLPRMRAFVAEARADLGEPARHAIADAAS